MSVVDIPWDVIVAIVVSVFGSSGFWAFMMAKQRSQSAEHKLILGIGYRSICELCGIYIKRGYITRDEYADLVKYLYEPYRDLGGNGTCERMMEEVKHLPIKES